MPPPVLPTPAPLLEGLRLQQIEGLLRLSRTLDLGDGESVPPFSGEGPALILVLEGELEVATVAKGVRVLGPGACFGDPDALDALAEPASVRSVGRARVRAWSRAALGRLLQADGEAHRRILANLVRIAARAERRLDAMLVGSAFDAVVELDACFRVLRWRSRDGGKVDPLAGGDGSAPGADLLERAPVLGRAVRQHAARALGSTTPIVFPLELDGARHLELTLGSSGPGSGWVLGIRDRTNLRLLEDRLIRAEKLALAGRMSAEIGHDLRNLLAGATGLAELLRADPSIRDLPGPARTVDLLAGQLARMQQFALGLLDLGRTGTRREPADLNALVERLAGFLEGQSRFRSVEFQRHLDPALPALSLDPGQIQQILLNLYANAVDALEGRRGGRIRTVTRGPRGGDPIVMLAVEDNGPGMTPEVRTRAFEPAFTTRDSGHGFGLAICRRIASSHGGTLDAENAPDGGARLVLRLPIP